MTRKRTLCSIPHSRKSQLSPQSTGLQQNNNLLESDSIGRHRWNLYMCWVMTDQFPTSKDINIDLYDWDRFQSPTTQKKQIPNQDRVSFQFLLLGSICFCPVVILEAVNSQKGNWNREQQEQLRQLWCSDTPNVWGSSAFTEWEWKISLREIPS